MSSPGWAKLAAVSCFGFACVPCTWWQFVTGMARWYVGKCASSWATASALVEIWKGDNESSPEYSVWPSKMKEGGKPVLL